MLPGKQYSIDDALHLLRRRYWMLIVPLALMGALAAAYTRTLPNVYAAETVIMVVPQGIPETYVQSTNTSRIEDRLPSLKTTILSRTRLERIIEQFDLYPELRRKGPMEDVVALMRDTVAVDTASGNSFKVGYTGSDPVKVMKVTDSLAEIFINESLLDRTVQAESTNQFLDSQLVEARTKLEEQERKLAAWKMAHAGELPNQYDANIQQAQNAQMGLRDIRESMNQDRSRRLELERQLGDLQNPMLLTAGGSVTPTSTDPVVAAATAGTAQQVAVAEAQLVAAEQRGLKPGHPELDAARRRLRDLQTKLAREVAAASVPGQTPRVAVSAAEIDRQRRIDALKSQIDQIDKNLVKAQEEEKRLQTVAADAQRRADTIPTRETEYSALTRDSQTLRTSYEQLLSSKQQAQISANLERRQVGEQFKLLDPAQLPERPVSPNRPRDIIAGMLLGLVFGVGLVGVLEFRDRSFKTDVEVASLIGLPVLAVVPIMKSDADVRGAQWRTVLVSTGLGSVVAGCLTFAAYVFVS